MQGQGVKWRIREGALNATVCMEFMLEVTDFGTTQPYLNRINLPYQSFESIQLMTQATYPVIAAHGSSSFLRNWFKKKSEEEWVMRINNDLKRTDSEWTHVSTLTCTQVSGFRKCFGIGNSHSDNLFSTKTIWMAIYLIRKISYPTLNQVALPREMDQFNSRLKCLSQE